MAQYKSSKKGPIKIDVVLWPLYPQGDILHLQTLDGPKNTTKDLFKYFPLFGKVVPEYAGLCAQQML